jgi:hypothetical protein
MCKAKNQRKNVSRSVDRLDVEEPVETKEMPKWKKQHLDFQNSVKYSNAVSKAETTGAAVTVPPPQ